MSRDRDRILEQALKHELRAAGTAPAGVCLDAETLGAWADGGLEPAAMSAVEVHVSSCARCQAIVGTVMKGASAVGTSSTVRTPSTLALWRWWLAPIAAGVTAVTLWMVVPEQTQLATAPPQPSDAKATQAPSAETIAPSAPAKDKEPVPEQSTDRLARNNKFAATAREDRPQEKQNEERKEEGAALQERAKLADAVAPAAPPAAAAPAPSATAARQAPAELAALQKNAPKIAAPPGIEVTNQSAPSESVCWFVGRAGLVLLTTDAGATFTRVDLAEPLDLASVSATDARHATVSTADGRRFRTDDGGRTWQPF